MTLPFLGNHKLYVSVWWFDEDIRRKPNHGNGEVSNLELQSFSKYIFDIDHLK